MYYCICNDLFTYLCCTMKSNWMLLIFVEIIVINLIIYLYIDYCIIEWLSREQKVIKIIHRFRADSVGTNLFGCIHRTSLVRVPRMERNSYRLSASPRSCGLSRSIPKCLHDRTSRHMRSTESRSNPLVCPIVTDERCVIKNFVKDVYFSQMASTLRLLISWICFDDYRVTK